MHVFGHVVIGQTLAAEALGCRSAGEVASGHAQIHFGSGHRRCCRHVEGAQESLTLLRVAVDVRVVGREQESTGGFRPDAHVISIIAQLGYQKNTPVNT